MTAASAAVAGMAVFLKDGRVVQVPVNKDDVVGISFEETAMPRRAISPGTSSPATYAAGTPRVTSSRTSRLTGTTQQRGIGVNHPTTRAITG